MVKTAKAALPSEGSAQFDPSTGELSNVQDGCVICRHPHDEQEAEDFARDAAYLYQYDQAEHQHSWLVQHEEVRCTACGGKPGPEDVEEAREALALKEED